MEQEQAEEKLIESDEKVEMRTWFDEVTEDDPPSLDNIIYIDDARSKEECPLEYMIKFKKKHSLINNYITDYTQKVQNVISEKPEERICLINRIYFRYLNLCYSRDLIQRARITYQNL